MTSIDVKYIFGAKMIGRLVGDIFKFEVDAKIAWKLKTGFKFMMSGRKMIYSIIGFKWKGSVAIITAREFKEIEEYVSELKQEEKL